jgi:hypothetical protein
MRQVNNWLPDVYGKSTRRVIVLACLMIIISILTIGTASYKIVERAATHKLKSQDLVYILKYMAARVDGRVQRATETSLLIADNPAVLKWSQSNEKNKEYQEMALKQLLWNTDSDDYTSIFIANASTGHF